MAGSTTNFSISYPTSTDLVKDGAVAIQTVAQGFDTRLGNVATYPNQIVNVVSGVSRPLPFAMSAGAFNVSGTNVVNNGSANLTLTFATSTRFTVPPIVTLTQTSLPSGSGSLVAKCSSPGTLGFSVWLYNVSGATVSWTNAQISYIAVQMTNAAAGNS